MRGCASAQKGGLLSRLAATGLHLSDIGQLVRIIDRLVDARNTVILIEHHPAAPRSGARSADALAEHHRDIVLQVAGWKSRRLDQRLHRRFHVTRARKSVDGRKRRVFQQAIGGDQEASRERLARNDRGPARAAAGQRLAALRRRQLDRSVGRDEERAGVPHAGAPELA